MRHGAGRRAGGTAAAVAGQRRPRANMRVLAPMPGRVLRVLVKPGDGSTPRQGLVVVEAMKMENEIASPKAGRVKDVAVAMGNPSRSGGSSWSSSKLNP